MTKYTIIFKNGKETTLTEEQGIRNRIDAYNHVIKNNKAKENGGVKEIKVNVIPR